jgi:hypothetical protein
MKNLNASFVLSLIVALTVGCSGQINGVIRRDAKRIEITYTDSRLTAAELAAVLPDGEQFRGKSESLDRTREAMETASTAGGLQSGGFEAVQSFPGNSKATLSGNRGNVIKCRFKITDVIIGFSSGGTGICQVSDGRVIDVFF